MPTTAVVTATESALTVTKVLSNVTPGKLATDPPAFNDLLQYVRDLRERRERDGL